MHLLDDVRLIEGEVLAPPTASTFERSITKLASYEHSDSWTKLCNSSWEYDQKPSLEENGGKIADFFGETRAEPVSVEHRSVEYIIVDLVQLAIRKLVGKLVLAI